MLEQGIKKIADCPPGTSERINSLIKPEHWDLITGRQEMFAPHSQTKSIFLRSVPDPVAKNDKDMFFEQGKLKDHEVLSYYMTELSSVLDILNNTIKISEWAASFILLPSMGQVKRHKDTYPAPESLRRYHLPIQTNPECIFYCGSYRVNMKIDTIYEVRNLNYIHGVDNFGTKDRIHLVIDAMGDLIS